MYTLDNLYYIFNTRLTQTLVNSLIEKLNTNFEKLEEPIDLYRLLLQLFGAPQNIVPTNTDQLYELLTKYYKYTNDNSILDITSSIIQKLGNVNDVFDKVILHKYIHMLQQLSLPENISDKIMQLELLVAMKEQPIAVVELVEKYINKDIPLDAKIMLLSIGADNALKVGNNDLYNQYTNKLVQLLDS